MFNLERKIDNILMAEIIERAFALMDTDKYPPCREDEDGEVIYLFGDCTDILESLNFHYNDKCTAREKLNKAITDASLVVNQTYMYKNHYVDMHPFITERGSKSGFSIR